MHPRHQRNTRRPGTRARAALAVALPLLGAAAAPVHAQSLLVDGTYAGSLQSFASVLGSTTSPMTTGVWGQEASTISGNTGLVSTLAGSTMLNMAYGGGITTQAGQVIDLAPAAATILSGGANANFGAFFNAAFSGAVGGVVVSFFTGNLYSSKIGPDFASALALDGSAASWERIAVSAPIPTAAKFALAQVYYSNPTLILPTGGTQRGFVDEAAFTVAVPEPSTWAMMALGAAGLAWRRRMLVHK